MSSNIVDAEVFVYTGAGGVEVPNDVVRVRVDDPSVTEISAFAFDQRKKLAEVELCEGVVEIGEGSFSWCEHSITKINISNSLRRINNWAFYNSLRTPIRLCNGIESIGTNAFAHCIFTNFRVPPLITEIPIFMLYGCKSIFSLETPGNISRINDGAFCNCLCLRNVAFPPNAVIGVNIFGEGSEIERSDLQRLLGSEADILRELMHRFDGLLIHSIVYYQSYNQGVLHNLIAAINMRSGQRRTLRSKLDPTGSQQDSLGMTPLHILACSSVHDIELYRVIVDNYPANLITEDGWGAVPLLYAFWGAATAEIIQFLVDSYQSLYSDHVFNWTNMVWTIGRCDTPKESIENLLRVKQMHFPEQPIDWDYLLDQFALPSCVSFSTSFKERMKFLITCGMSDRVEALAFKVWRDHITSMIHTAAFVWNRDNSNIIQRIRAGVAHFVEELAKLKDITTIIELALWKLSMNEKISPEEATPRQKKIKTDESNIRRQCRITCGADVVIQHVLPYLISTEDEESV